MTTKLIEGSVEQLAKELSLIVRGRGPIFEVRMRIGDLPMFTADRGGMQDFLNGYRACLENVRKASR